MQRVRSDRKAVLFGEIMMRLATKRYERIVQAREFDVSYGGAEANVGVALSRCGVESFMVSAVPDDAVGDACLAYMRQFNLNLDYVKRVGQRLGIYFLETGAAQRPSSVLYYRRGSSVCELQPGAFDWDRIFEGKHWFHVTGITPALADSVADITMEACAAARRSGLMVSLDPNYRRGLWPVEKARTVLMPLLEHVSVLFTDEEQASDLFGVDARASGVTAGHFSERGHEDVAVQLHDRFGLQYVSISLRKGTSATVNDCAGMLYDGATFYTSRNYHIDHIVDRVGGGDAYAAGIIYGLLTAQDLHETVEFAAAASSLKHAIHGDFNLVSFDEIVALMTGDGSGRIQR